MSATLNSARTVLLQGDRTVRQAAELGRLLQEVADGPGDVVLCLEEVASIDTSAVCSILALKRILRGEGRSVTFRWPRRKEVADLLSTTGIQRFMLKY